MMGQTHPFRLILHLGAHKTATTYLQSILAANRLKLSQAGVGFLPLDQVRHEVTGQLAHGKISAPSLVERFSSPDHPLPSVICYSDENLLGTCPQMVAQQRIYPTAGRLPRAIAKHIGEVDTTVCLCIRSHSTFLVSVWAEALRAGLFVPFPQYIEKAINNEPSWLPIIDAVQEALPWSRVVVWQFEHLRALHAEIISALTGGLISWPDLEVRPEQKVRPSMSMKGYRLLHLMENILGQEVAAEHARTVALKALVGKDGAPIRALKPKQSAILNSAYEADVNAIRSRDDIRFLQPSSL
jgi:hypothetical protein